MKYKEVYSCVNNILGKLLFCRKRNGVDYSGNISLTIVLRPTCENRSDELFLFQRPSRILLISLLTFVIIPLNNEHKKLSGTEEATQRFRYSSRHGKQKTGMVRILVIMNHKMAVKKIFESKPVGRRKMGRHRLRWMEDVEKDLRKMKVKRW
jgi:hypothetical protein